MQAIILVGGRGTRLRSVIKDVPKPMAPIYDKPFLAYLLNYLHSQGFTSVVFSACYLWEPIQNYFQSSYKTITIDYAIEKEPLGTGGAIQNAFAKVNGTSPLFVLNGDTFIKLNYQAMLKQHQKSTLLTMALRPVPDCSRYGKVLVADKKIIGFKEKGVSGRGLINAGVYLCNPDLFSQFALPKQFSFEKDFILNHLISLKPQAFITHDNPLLVKNSVESWSPSRHRES